MKLQLQIENIDEVTKFMSPLVNINHSPFDFTWFKNKEDNINDSKKYVEEIFFERFELHFPDKKIDYSDIYKKCKILKIHDDEDSELYTSCIYYDYEIYDKNLNKILVTHCEELNHNSGTVHHYLHIELAEK